MGELIDMNSHNSSGGKNKDVEAEPMMPKMKKELSKKELKIEERGKLKEIKENLEITQDIQCGIGCIRGSFLQKFANQEAFVIVYGILGAMIAAGSSYFSGVLSTMEKRFRIPSQNIGIILIGNDVTSLFFGLLITYYAGRKHKPRWMAVGMLFFLLFFMISFLPHLIYGPGKEALALTVEGEHLLTEIDTNSTLDEGDSTLCSKATGKCIQGGSLTPQIIFFVAQLLYGIGSPLYGNLGIAYMDDNIKKSQTPVLISISYFIKMLGPIGGYALASFSLSKYIAINSTPVINTSDPRWVGAWWLGWIFVTLLAIPFTILILLFPKQLPNHAVRKILSEQNDDVTDKKEEEFKTSWKDMAITFHRLLKNKVLIFNTAASCFYVFGYYPYWTFMPKYLEIQYRVSASKAALVTGVVGLVFTAMGILLAGGCISKVKPKARTLAAFNIFTGLLTMAGIFSYIYLGCSGSDAYNLRVSKESQDGLNFCNANCNCEFSSYAPICSMDGLQRTYISPCHAGCRSEKISSNGNRIFLNCSCIAVTNRTLSEFGSNPPPVNYGGSAQMGGCFIDCSTQLFLFVGVVCILKLSGAAAKTTNVLLSVRCVEEKDKAVSMSFSMTALALFGFIPAPIAFGWLMDKTCVLWGKTCSGTGNCWVYDAAKLRTILNLTTLVFIGIANIMDIAVWYYVKDIKIFDEKPGDEKENKGNEESKTEKA